jgi:antitoxin component of MazEF toxin-antitoxin module
MVLRVERRGDEYFIPVPQQAMAELHLQEGAAVDVRATDAPAAQEPVIQSLSVEETLQTYRDTLPQHIEAYRELAK